MATLRVAVPAEILRRVELGLAMPGGAGFDGWWRCVEARMHRFVFDRIPSGARHVHLAFDDDTMEVVATFELEAPGA